MIQQQYPSQLLEKAVQEFSKLPGIGRKTALRLVLWLLNVLAPLCDCLRSPLPKYRPEEPVAEVAVPIEEMPAAPISEAADAEPAE